MAAKNRIPKLIQSDLAKKWANDSMGWSPQDLFGGTFFANTISSLTVKRSLTSRFFMYEEHAGSQKLHDKDGPTETLQLPPSHMAELMTDPKDCYYYWTSPITAVAPGLLKQRLPDYESLYEASQRRFLDPRGPSLWIGSSGSGTQAHYDVADNVLIQLHGTKRIQCFPPNAAHTLHVFPDAHPRARKSQVNFDKPDLDKYPFFSNLQPPALDVVLNPGDAIQIPAFWFHHVENGKLPNDSASIDGPSVSLNMFSLSQPMMTAQSIFQHGSLGAVMFSKQIEYYRSVAILRALGIALVQGLNLNASSSPTEYIHTHLLQSRYAPLQSGDSESPPDSTREITLDQDQEQGVKSCIERVLSEFGNLEPGIAELVALHLMEMWAVQLVGAQSVYPAWNDAIATHSGRTADQ